MAVGDKYKHNIGGSIYEVLYENREGKLLKRISEPSCTDYYTNARLCNFSLIKEPRKTEKRYAIVYECKDGSLILGNDLHSQRHDAEWYGKNHLCNKFHSILEIQYTEKL